MDFGYFIGIVSGLAGIATIFLPDRVRSNRLTMVAALLLVVLMSSVITYQNTKLGRINKVSRAAGMLIQQRPKFTDKSFILACLTFIEQHKDLYPSVYQRMNQIETELEQGGAEMPNAYARAASDVEGMLRGIAILSTIDEN